MCRKLKRHVEGFLRWSIYPTSPVLDLSHSELQGRSGGFVWPRLDLTIYSFSTRCAAQSSMTLPRPTRWNRTEQHTLRTSCPKRHTLSIYLLTFASGFGPQTTDVKMRNETVIFCLLRGCSRTHSLGCRFTPYRYAAMHHDRPCMIHAMTMMADMADGGSSGSGEPLRVCLCRLCRCLHHDAAPRSAMLGGAVQAP